MRHLSIKAKTGVDVTGVDVTGVDVIEGSCFDVDS
ncbi:MAG: hypothetical protein ACI9W6_002170 [Motiliproteus sp.]|jgi:hypothetical protein